MHIINERFCSIVIAKWVELQAVYGLDTFDTKY